MFEKILIANRGEIALRVIRACRELGIKAVAVYSDADAQSLHVREADEAYRLGPASPAQSYLNVDRIFEIAREAGCDALHPGYGFLAENAPFASRCVAQRVAWIGPAPKAIEAMGSKIAARRVAIAAGVAVVPGSALPVTDADEVKRLAGTFGYPVAIKAVAGGGGKGLKIARDAREVDGAFALAGKEAAAYFHDSTLYVERYLPRRKHVEVQVLGDKFGDVVHLGARDCSLQRRHQKLVEETPALVDDGMLARLLESGATLARAITYDSAGTIEFLVQDDEFFFLEMNTRIQVEHTVTEMTWGIDLVKAQIRIAAGERLWFGQSDIAPRGHAIECRINAESPALDFRPSPGRVVEFRPPAGPGVRVDTAGYPGLLISQEYDSLVAKLVAWGVDREEARRRMLRALDEFLITGIDTTIQFFKLLLQEPGFTDGTYATPMIDEFVRDRAAEIARAYPRLEAAAEPAAAPTTRIVVEVNGKRFDVRVFGEPTAAIGMKTAAPKRRYGPPKRVAHDSEAVESPLHGIVSEIRVAAGDSVAHGQVVAIIEAMKMMNEIVAHRDGMVRSVEVKPGDTVESGAALVRFAN